MSLLLCWSLRFLSGVKGEPEVYANLLHAERDLLLLCCHLIFQHKAYMKGND